MLLYETGRLTESLLPMQKLLEVSPRDPHAHYNLGATLKELGRLSEAELSFNKAIVLSPDSAEAHNYLGTTLLELGRSAEAEASINQAIALDRRRSSLQLRSSAPRLEQTKRSRSKLYPSDNVEA